MITPVNGHFIIKPFEHKTFLPTEKGTYEEVGTIVDMGDFVSVLEISRGDKVYFDSWLASKYPTGKEDEFFWLVKWSDIRAFECYVPDQISK